MTQQLPAVEPAAATSVPAVELLAVLLQPTAGDSASITARLQVGASLMNCLLTEGREMPVDLQMAVAEASAAATADQPTVDAEEVLQALLDAANVKPLVDVILQVPCKDLLIKQVVLQILTLAAAREPAVAEALAATAGCLSGNVRLVTNSSTEEQLKVAVLQLLGVMSRHAVAAEQLVQQQKLVPALVQLVGEVKVVKGKAAVCLAPAAVQQQQQRASSAAGSPEAAAAVGGASRRLCGGRSAAGGSAASAGNNRTAATTALQATANGSAGSRMPSSAGAKTPVTAAAAESAAVALAAVRVLQVLSSNYMVSVVCSRP